MVRRFESEPPDADEQLGEAIESYLALAEKGPPPEPEVFAARYPDLGDELIEALEGLALVRGLVGDATGGGLGHRLESGRRIAGYRIVRELGRGGMGIVYEAVHVGLDRPVALKVLGAHAAPDSSGRRRFLNEARTAAGLHHTHIVPVFDVGQVGGLCYYAMQRIEGCGLDRVVRHLRKDRTTAAGSTYGSGSPGKSKSKSRSKGPGPSRSGRPSLGDETASWAGGRGDAEPGLGADRDDEPMPFEPPRGSAYYRWVAEVGRQAAEALAHAHHRGVIHRDVKPSNLLVDARGLVWVADFGLARRLADPGLTQHDGLLGTPRYMSPEQARPGPIDGRTDVYSLGATLYELLTLRPPFEGRTAAELVEQIGSREPVPPRRSDPRVPRDLETILLKALAKRPTDRYATAGELADDLGRFLRLEPVRARRISPFGRLWRLARRHPGISAVSTAATAAILTVATVAYVRVVHERDEKGRALEQLKTEIGWKENALREQYVSGASVFRLTNAPNRREKGLILLRKAAALRPDPTLRARLRDEAVEFLGLRDVEERRDFPIGRARGLVFTPEGNRFATLADAGDELSLWDTESRRRLDRHALRAEGSESAPAPAANGPNRGGGPPWQRALPQLAAAGPCVVVVRPGGRGLRLFDTETGVVRDLEAPGRSIQSVYATRDGRRLVTIDSAERGRPGGPPESRINLWDPGPDVEAGRLVKPIATLAAGEPETRDRGPSPPIVAIAPDGKVIATVLPRQTTASLWSAEDGKALGEIKATAELTALAIGPDGLLATASGGAVQLWDPDTRRPRTQASLTPAAGYIRLLRFNPRGTLLAVASGNGPGVELWDATSHSLIAVLSTPDRVSDLAFSPDGRTLAAAVPGAAATAWSVLDPVAQVRLSGFESWPIRALSFRQDGLLAIEPERGDVRFWQPGRCPSTLQACEDIPELGNDPAPGRPLALAFDDRGRLPRLTEGVHLALSAGRVEFRPNAPATVARSQGGRTLFLGYSGRVFAWHSDRPDTVELLDLPAREELAGFEFDRRRRGFGRPPIVALAASPSGDRLYLADPSGELMALAIDGQHARRLDWKLPERATNLALSPDGATLALADRQGRVALVDTAQGVVKARFRQGLAATAEGPTRFSAVPLAFAPDGRMLAVGTPQGPVELWATDEPSAPLLRIADHRARNTPIAFDAEGRRLATVGDRFVDVWDLNRIRAELERLGLGW